MNTKTKSQEKNKMCEIDDHIFKYFEIKRRLGKGAYGIVWKALHRKTNQTMAVKKIFDAFRDETDAQRTFREIMFLRAFRDHPCVIQLHNVYRASNNLDIYLSFEFMESDLHNVIKKGNVLKDIHKRFIMYQLFNAICYIHSGNVIHRDLKPSNVLIDTKCNCKLADFGLARSVSNQQMRDAVDANDSIEPMLTDYVATRWYRAPEILVASKRYTKGIDMWSLGCILGEMIRGKPIFQGNSTVDQIEKIVSALPDITERDIISVGAGFGTALLNKTNSKNSNVTLDELLLEGPNDAIDLVKQLLVLDPMARLTAIEALNHKYVERFQHKLQLIELNSDVKPPFHDDIRLTVNEYRSKLYEMIQQSEKTNISGKAYSFNRKREPKAQIKTFENISSKFNNNTNEEKIRRNVYRSQERKCTIRTPPNDLSALPKAVARPSIKVKSVNSSSGPNTGNGNYPRNKIITVADKEQRDEALATKSRYSNKSSVRTSQNSGTKPVSSSSEIASFQNKAFKPSVEKRHSVDGSCIHNPVTYISNHSSGSEKSTAMVPIPEKIKFINSGLRKSYQNINLLADNDQITSSNSKNKTPITSKDEEHTQTNDSTNYYEKRIKRLEEQIEKHRRDVKALCRENIKNVSKIGPSYKKRQPETVSETKIALKDKFYINGNGKNCLYRPTVGDNNAISGKFAIKQTSSGRFDYFLNNNEERQAIFSKYADRKLSKIM